jgi:CheY-like chemotaxis protein
MTTDARLQGTILIVEDLPDIQKIARRVLEREGATVLTASDGVEALEVFEAHKDNLTAVLLDLSLPRLRGEEVLAQMQTRRHDLPVVVASGWDEHEVVKRAPNPTATAFLAKPFRPSELTERIRSVIARR